MTKTEALKQAIEALMEHGTAYLGHSKEYQLAVIKSKEALAQAEQEPKQNYLSGYCVGQSDLLAEQAKQKPVAWAMYQKGRLLSFWMDKGDAYDFEFTLEHRWEPLYTTPPQGRTFDDYGNKIV